eukprot:2572317-Pyramimonas_sp.AAC.1
MELTVSQVRIRCARGPQDCPTMAQESTGKGPQEGPPKGPKTAPKAPQERPSRAPRGCGNDT